MFGLFGKGSKPEVASVEPTADWNSKTNTVVLVDRQGRMTSRKNPFPIAHSEFEVVSIEIVRNEVRFTLNPIASKNKDGRNKPRVVVLDLRGKLVR